MSSDEQNDEDQGTSEEVTSEEAPKPKVVNPADLYYVHNVTRGRHNRTLRASGPKHHGLKQSLGGGKYRSLRGRPIALTREQVGQHAEELTQKVAAGIFEVRTHDGRIVDMRTGDAAPRNAGVLLPHPIHDSIANDTRNIGQPMPQYPGGDVEGVLGEEPELLQDRDEDPAPPPAAVTPPAEGEETDEELPDLVNNDDVPADKPTTPDKARSGRRSR